MVRCNANKRYRLAYNSLEGAWVRPDMVNAASNSYFMTTLACDSKMASHKTAVKRRVAAAPHCALDGNSGRGKVETG